MCPALFHSCCQRSRSCDYELSPSPPVSWLRACLLNRALSVMVRSRSLSFFHRAVRQIKADEPFIGTLDYIFIRDGNEGAAGAGTAEAADGEGGGRWEVAGADALPNRSEVKGPYPSSTEPSDHVAVAATLRLVGGAVVAGAAAQQQ